MAAASPRTGLSWLDIGCGTGSTLRLIRDRWQPSRLSGVDIIDWLDADLRESVDLHLGPAEGLVDAIEPVDRVLLVETLEHLEAPWRVLRAAAQLVKPGGALVATTPNVSSLRHRLELAARGQLTAFRPDNEPHLQPVLPHVTRRILREEGFDPAQPRYAERDIVPKLGLQWPAALQARRPDLLSLSVVVSATRRT